MTEGAEMAETAVERLHMDYNAERFDKIYDAATKEYKAATTREMNNRLFKTIRKRLGKVVDAKRTGWNVNATTNGTFVSLVYETEFEKGKGQESYQMKVYDGSAKMNGFNVNSPELMVELEE
ncbi:DUF3887 domain-containing protein [Parasphingorhabdus halotolerans]|uniref:DUF4019 domain-containing protein n=1 Tax=Parasphingorhabdus halotolerans TaxID=2725558 RepID=A0A6H2DIF4_9SPHN|nr:DUF3887 domain-containing protein [Parasphingorhabdus halotolerans]QJB67968.1 hypothetical protein HF685_00455 [Parasphingorhabdus halotolerans]